MTRPALVLSLLFGTVSSHAADPAETAYENGIKHYIAEDYKKAQDALEQAIRADQGNPRYHLWLGRTLGRRAETATGFKVFSAYGLARKTRLEFQRAVDLDGKHLDSLDSLFTYYLEAPGIAGGSDSKARKIAKQIDTVNEAKGARAWASFHEADKNFDAAEAALEKARKLEPDEIGHLLSHASYLARRGWSDKADELFKEALNREPDNPSVWHSRAKAIIRGAQAANYGEARELLWRYLATPLASPDDEPYSKVRKLLKEI